jgi:lipopolysaccharide/colanic/teichoic acid biosynthesis glycosyltransferase
LQHYKRFLQQKELNNILTTFNVSKRFIDLIISLAGIILLAPVVIPIMFIIWNQDKYSPFYIASRVGKNRRQFKMLKLRSMTKNAELSGVDSTSSEDSRITNVGKFIRRYKLDEVPQLLNVLIGQMSLVGPRPNVKNETDLYTAQENKLLDVKPGITDIASIVFSDEGEILKGKSDPDIAYNQLIRPGKSELGLLYVQKRSLFLDFNILYLTLLAQVNRKRALERISLLVRNLGGTNELSMLCLRNRPLMPTPPPGSKHIVTSRNKKN